MEINITELRYILILLILNSFLNLTCTCPLGNLWWNLEARPTAPFTSLGLSDSQFVTPWLISSSVATEL